MAKKHHSDAKILRALHRCNGNVTKAARLARCTPHTIRMRAAFNPEMAEILAARRVDYFGDRGSGNYTSRTRIPTKRIVEAIARTGSQKAAARAVPIWPAGLLSRGAVDPAVAAALREQAERVAELQREKAELGRRITNAVHALQGA